MGRGWRLGLIIIALVFALMGGVWFASHKHSKRPFTAPKSAQQVVWPIQVGLRVAMLRDKIPTVDRVVVVPDEATFLFALQQWSLAGRWPILIDDEKYTPMFIRRFQPAEVIRLPSINKPLPTGNELYQLMLRAIAAAWNANKFSCPEDVECYVSLPDIWEQLGWEPPGVVLTSENDPAWPAAVALAADRGQPLIFLNGNFGLPNDRLELEQWQPLKIAVEQAVKEGGYSYSKLGDPIDTVTIVREMAVKYRPSKDFKGELAVTDGLARHQNGDRWAVVGWIFGSRSRSVYQAMCSIFLDQKTAFLYNSYPPEKAWRDYKLEQASGWLTQAGLNVKLVQRPEAKLGSWRNLTSSGLDFDVVFVNSKGEKGAFEVGNGPASVEEIPELKFPAAVHFIHSWSATTPNDTNTVGGRWLENGAYIYVGSVHEPYLSAFIPPKLMARRLLDSSPFLISARQLQSKPWKITTIGDPLMIMTQARQRIAPSEQPIQQP